MSNTLNFLTCVYKADRSVMLVNGKLAPIDPNSSEITIVSDDENGHVVNIYIGKVELKTVDTTEHVVHTIRVEESFNSNEDILISDSERIELQEAVNKRIRASQLEAIRTNKEEPKFEVLYEENARKITATVEIKRTVVACPRTLPTHHMGSANAVLAALNYHSQEPDLQKAMLKHVLLDTNNYPALHKSKIKLFGTDTAVVYYMSELKNRLPKHCLPTLYSAIIKSSELSTSCLELVPKDLRKQNIELCETHASIRKLNNDELTSLIIRTLTDSNLFELNFSSLLEALRNRLIATLNLSELGRHATDCNSDDWEKRIIPGLKRIVPILLENQLDNCLIDNRTQETSRIFNQFFAFIESGYSRQISLSCNDSSTTKQYKDLETRLLGITIPASKSEIIKSYYSYTNGLSWTALRLCFMNRKAIGTYIEDRSSTHSGGASEKTCDHWSPESLGCRL